MKDNNIKLLLCFLVLTIVLQGCVFSIGLAVHPTNLDEPEVNLDSVVGVVRVEKKLTNNIVGFGEHVSGIATKEHGRGLNMVGVMVRIK